MSRGEDLAVSAWWENVPAERYWLEITSRDDIGANLNAPLFSLIAAWKVEEVAWLKWLLAAVFLVSGALFAMMMGVGRMVRVADVGYWQRAYAVSSILWVGVLAWALHSRLRAASPASA